MGDHQDQKQESMAPAKYEFNESCVTFHQYHYQNHYLYINHFEKPGTYKINGTVYANEGQGQHRPPHPSLTNSFTYTPAPPNSNSPVNGASAPKKSLP